MPKRTLSLLFLLTGLFSLSACLAGCSASPVGTPAGAVVGRYDRYDYSPSVIQSGDVQQFWWCGRAPNPSDPSQDTDTILFESINTATRQQVGPVVVLAETAGAWDAEYTCNPQVIRGVFVNPLGDAQTYTYAMYYVGTKEGTNNSIGVAFSNDGLQWTKYPQPVILSTNPYGYGPAQPIPYNSDQKQAVWLFYEDDDPLPPNHHTQAISTDGVHFKNVGNLTTKGLAIEESKASWGDLAYDPISAYWYATFHLPSRIASTTGDVTELGSVGIQLYRIPQNDLLAGKTGWQQLKTFDTNLTGYEMLFLAGFLRDAYGNLYADSKGSFQIFPSFTNRLVSWNANPADAAATADPSTWDVGTFSWSASDPALVTLNRYNNAVVHLVTTGWVDPGGKFSLERSLGKLYVFPQQGATTAFYGCKAGERDNFISLDSGCEGQHITGINGYGYDKPVAGVALTAVYRCSSGHDHFVSTDAQCEGDHTEQLLGYTVP